MVACNCKESKLGYKINCVRFASGDLAWLDGSQAGCDFGAGLIGSVELEKKKKAAHDEAKSCVGSLSCASCL